MQITNEKTNSDYNYCSADVPIVDTMAVEFNGKLGVLKPCYSRIAKR